MQCKPVGNKAEPGSSWGPLATTIVASVEMPHVDDLLRQGISVKQQLATCLPPSTPPSAKHLGRFTTAGLAYYAHVGALRVLLEQATGASVEKNLANCLTSLTGARCTALEVQWIAQFLKYANEVIHKNWQEDGDEAWLHTVSLYVSYVLGEPAPRKQKTSVIPDPPRALASPECKAREARPTAQQYLQCDAAEEARLLYKLHSDGVDRADLKRWIDNLQSFEHLLWPRQDGYAQLETFCEAIRGLPRTASPLPPDEAHFALFGFYRLKAKGTLDDDHQAELKTKTLKGLTIERVKPLGLDKGWRITLDSWLKTLFSLDMLQ